MLKSYCLVIGVPFSLLMSVIKYYDASSTLFYANVGFMPLIFISSLAGFCLVYHLYRKVTKTEESRMIENPCLVIGVPFSVLMSAIRYYDSSSALFYLNAWLLPLTLVSWLAGFCLMHYLYRKIAKKP